MSSPRTVRIVTYGLAGLGAFLSMMAAITSTGSGATTYVWPAIPVSIAVAWRWPAHRPVALAIGAGLVAAGTITETGYLCPAVAALTFGSIAQDPSPRPWIGWVGGLTGAAVSLPFFLDDGAGPLSFMAVGIGTVGALLLRWTERTASLTAETTRLRDQAVWLEQRTTLARELHDVVGHHVTAMVVQAEAGLVGDPTAALHAISDLGRTALGELDSLVVHLRDPDAPLVLTAPPRLGDIDELLAVPLRRQGIEATVHIDSTLDLEDGQIFTVYRIAQEAMTNISRHARATTACVELQAVPGGLWLRVTDDGVGPPDAPTRGVGLVGIEERVGAAGGTWTMTPGAAGGTVVDVRLPRLEREDA